MKKVLIITYYWPPSGGGGVQRWVKMSKYLPDFGWEPIVFKPENPDYPIIDSSFNDEVSNIKTISAPIWEPSRFLKNIGAEKEANLSSGFVSEGKSWKQNFAIWVRSNFFIPDARKFWISPSVNKLSDYLKKNKVDAIISTGPPHSCHIIGLKIKKKFPQIKWLADFRDPWTNIDFYKQLDLTDWADKKHHKLEAEVAKRADCIVTIGKTMGEEYKTIGAKNVEVITNGYDSSSILNTELDIKFTITHIGTLGKGRNPKLLWKVLQKICLENLGFKNDLKVQLIGSIDGEVKASITNYELDSNIEYKGLVPNSESLKIQSKSQLLLLLINNTANAKGILTGKFFEYMVSQRPILAIGPKDGDAAEILNETNSGVISGYNDFDLLEQQLLNFYDSFKKGTLKVDSKNIKKYSRKELANNMSKTLNNLIGES